MIRIRSKQAGFRRCGIGHLAEAREYKDDHFSAAELKILQAEPMLIVEIVEDGQSDEKSKEQPATPAEILAAIHALDPANDKLWTGDGVPTVPAICEALGKKITAKDRDQAWAGINQSKN